MALVSNLTRINDNKAEVLEKANIIASLVGLFKSGENVVQAEDDERGQVALEEFVKTATTELVSLTFFESIGVLQQVNAELQKEARDVLTKLENGADGVQQVETTAQNGEIATLIGGVLPGVGPVITRLQLNKLLGKIDDDADPLQREITNAIQTNKDFIAKLEEEEKVLNKLEIGGRAIELTYSTIDLAAEFISDAAEDNANTVASASTSLGALSTDERVETAFNGLTKRFDNKTTVFSAQVDQFAALADPIETVIREQIGPALQAIADKVGALTSPLNAIDNVADGFRPFIDAVGVFGNPINEFLDTLAEGPGILPAIPRSAINSVIDFLSGLSGLLSSAFDFFFGALLAPLDNLANSLFAKLIDLNPLSNPLDLVDRLVSEALSALDIVTPLVEGIQSQLAALIDLPAIGLEEFVADQGDLRETFFGADTDDVIVGVASIPDSAAAATNGDDIAGAILNGGGGNDDLTGTAQEDLLIGGAGDDTLRGEGRADVLVGGQGDDELIGGAGNDVIDGGGGVDIAIFSGAFADYSITEEDFVLKVQGADGTDDVIGVETLRFDDQDVATRNFLPADFPGVNEKGGAGDDNLEGGDGGDTLKGGGGDDFLKGGRGKDDLRGNAGNDNLAGNAGDDTLKGGGGDDMLRGGGGSDDLRGGGGDDTLKGGGGADRMKGNGGDDDLRGGGGADVIIGGRGDDTMTGNGGADRFEFTRGDGDDMITGFQQGADKIVFRQATDIDDLAITQVGDDVLIRFDNVSVTVEDQLTSQFTDSDFIF